MPSTLSPRARARRLAERNRRWVRELSPQARQARAQWLAQLEKRRAREQPERARRIQEQWNLVLRELEQQPEWVQLKSQQQLGQVQQEETQKWSAARQNTIIMLLSRFLQERVRIEWVGDLYEMREEWQKQGLTRWSINLRTSGVALHLLLAQSRCIVYDRVFARYWGKSL
jgi:hypothetical protein